MNNRFLVTAMGAAAMAVTGCAYQGGSGYNHSAYPTYSSYGGTTSYANRCGTTYTPQGCAVVGGTRVELGIGAEKFVDGDSVNGGIVTGPNTSSTVEYADAFKTGYRASIGLARDVRPSTTILAKGFYKQAEGEDGVTVATNGGGNVTGNFSDYESYGAELGLRQYLSPANSRFRPFVGATAGATYIEDISLSTGGPAVVINDAGWSATASATGGFEMPISRSASLALEPGIRWEGKQDRSALATAIIGDDNSRLSVPVTLRGRFRF